MLSPKFQQDTSGALNCRRRFFGKCKFEITRKYQTMMMIPGERIKSLIAFHKVILHKQPFCRKNCKRAALGSIRLNLIQSLDGCLLVDWNLVRFGSATELNLGYF